MIDYSRLRDIREDHDITQDKMAKILGVKRSTYSLWELGISIIPLTYLSLFADYFHYSMDYILGVTNSRKVSNFVTGFSLQTLGENMKEVRKKHHLNQKQMAEMMDVTQACIVRYEKGQICISTSNLYQFCRKFSLSFQEICGKGKIKIDKNNIV